MGWGEPKGLAVQRSVPRCAKKGERDSVEVKAEPWIEAVPALEAEAIQTRLARELHDSVGQILTTMVVELEQFRRDQYGRKSVIDEIDRVQADVRAVLASLRGVLNDLRDEPAETHFVDDLREVVRRAGERSPITFSLDIDPRAPESLSTQVGRHVLRVVEEAITNARRHSGASTVEVRVRADDGGLSVSVEDDGAGMDAVLRLPGSFGLRGMRERATLLGGRLDVEACEPQGTRVRLVVPATSIHAYPEVSRVV